MILYRSIWKLSLFCILILFTAGCSKKEANPHTKIVIFAASSLTNAFEELADQFEKNHPAASILLNFGSSSQLAAQILEGVYGDIYASANEIQMGIVQNAGELMGAATTFTTNSLAIGVPYGNPLNIQNLEDLAAPHLRLVLAVPNTPVREYSDTLVKNNLRQEEKDVFYNNIVSEESNVRQVVTKIALGEADAGIIYTSDITPDIASLVTLISIPQARNIIAKYPIAVLKHTSNYQLAAEFVQYILSEEGQSILKKWGFGQ